MPLQKHDFIIKQNDTLPALQMCVIGRGCLNEKIPFDLTSVTGATFTMVDKEGCHKVIAQPAQIISASGGTIQYNWTADDTNEPGMFSGEFQLTFADGNKLSVPQTSPIQIEIPRDLNPW